METLIFTQKWKPQVLALTLGSVGRDCGLGGVHLCTIAENTLWFKWFMITLILWNVLPQKTDLPGRLK